MKIIQFFSFPFVESKYKNHKIYISKNFDKLKTTIFYNYNLSSVEAKVEAEDRADLSYPLHICGI